MMLAGCADREPPGPTEEEIAAQAAEEARAAQAAEEAARAAAEELASAAQTRLIQTLGVAEAEVTIGNRSATADYPISATVSFMPDVAASVLVDAASGLWTALTIDGLTVVSLALDVKVTPFLQHEASWRMEGLGPQIDGQIRVWARTIAANPGLEVTLTSESADPFFLMVYNSASLEVPRTTGVVYRGVVDTCVELGVDPTNADLFVQASWYSLRTKGIEVPAEVLAAAEIAELEQSAVLNQVEGTQDGYGFYFIPRYDGRELVLSAAAQQALLDPFRTLGVLDDRLHVGYHDNLTNVILWPQA